MVSDCFVIVNPQAGRGAAHEAWPRAQARLAAAGVQCEVAETTGPGHATVLAERAAGQWGAVVAVGGDGTVHEVVNGLMRAAGAGPSTPMGILPLGTGNDFVKMLDFPVGDPLAAADRLIAGARRQVDVGRVGERYFINGLGVGFDARVAIEAQKVRWLRGMAVYLWALVRTLQRHRCPTVRLTLDGIVHEQAITLVAVSNGACSGGGFWLSPQARLDDGRFDVCIAAAMGPLRILRFVPQVMRGRHTTRPEVKMAQARQIIIHADEGLPVHADGEIIATAAHDLEVELLPGRLTVIV